MPSVLYNPINDVLKFVSLTSDLEVTQASLVRATSNGNVKVIAFNPASPPHMRVNKKVVCVSVLPRMKKFLKNSNEKNSIAEKGKTLITAAEFPLNNPFNPCVW